METAFFGASKLRRFLPEDVSFIKTPKALAARRWDLLALTREACRTLERTSAVYSCKTLLLPGDADGTLRYVESERVVDYGFSSKNSLTISGLAEQTVVCVQRVLFLPDGGAVEPQEIPLPKWELPPEDLLAVSGVWLLTGKRHLTE